MHSIYLSPFFSSCFNLFESTWKKYGLIIWGGKNSFNLQKMVGLFYLHFLYMHESWKKIKGESALPNDPTWLYPPPSTITSSQLGADCSLAAFKQLHSTQLLENWFPALLRVFIFYCPSWSHAATICKTIASLGSV